MYNLEQVNSVIRIQTWSSFDFCFSIWLSYRPNYIIPTLTDTTASTLEDHKKSISVHSLESFENIPHLFNSPNIPISWEKHKGSEQEYFPLTLQWKVHKVNGVHVGGRKLFGESMLDARHTARFFQLTSFDLHSSLRDGHRDTHFNNKRTRRRVLYISREYIIHLQWQL